ncbi:hypothetical protein PENTCL1PPCAC_21765 [Pristionchus entomophagus]|uniref:G protein-coupled receptor n=1 Tax=Pristionchus entomophagus TaxID=358040 RepID=A0AAV5TYJ0_9BILA|nr:hypothetical protein PENTCL1PPCAC_21765 [Pristionchus entomophagus]
MDIRRHVQTENVVHCISCYVDCVLVSISFIGIGNILDLRRFPFSRSSSIFSLRCVDSGAVCGLVSRSRALMCLSVSEMVSALVPAIVSSWIVTSDLPWQSGLIVGPMLSIVPLVILVCAKSHIRNVEASESKRGLSKIFYSAFSIFSIKSYLLIAASSSFGMLQLAAYSFWFASVYLLAWTNVPQIFFGLSYTAITAINSLMMVIGMG